MMAAKRQILKKRHFSPGKRAILFFFFDKPGVFTDLCVGSGRN